METTSTTERLEIIKKYVCDYRNGVQNIDIDNIMACIDELEIILDNHEARLIMMEMVMLRVKEIYENVTRKALEAMRK